MNNDKLRTGISYLFTFFLAFFLFVIVLMSSVRFTLMDQGYFLERMDEVKYYNNTATELNRLIKQNARAAGFEVSSFESLVKEEDIRDAMINYEKQKLAGESVTISVDGFKERMETTIRTYINNNNLVVDQSVQQSLDQFVNACVEKYSYLTQFPYLDVYGNLMNLYQKGYMIGLPLLSIVAIALGFFVSRLHKSSRRIRRFYAYGLIGAGLLVAVAPMVLYALRFFEKINLEPKYMYDLLVSMTRTLLMSNIIVGLVLIILGILVTYIKPKKKKKKDKTDRKYPNDDMLKNIERE